MDKLETDLQNSPAAVIDAAGQTVLPAWCDSHTHLVFAASREEEFIDKIKGLSYAEIAARGGGILNSARKLNNCPEDELFRLSWSRLQEVIALQQKHSAEKVKEGVGKVHRVLIEGTSKKSEEMFFGRNTQNTVVVFPKENFRKGEYVDVLADNCSLTTLIGKVLHTN